MTPPTHQQRPLRFRAWDEPDGYNRDVGCMTFYDIHDAIGDVDVIMQSTGLRDVKGVEIFEGDIVLDAERGAISEGVFFDQEHAAFYSWWRYHKPMAYQRKDAFSGGYFHAERAARCEVIGNIYQHPHLLK